MAPNVREWWLLGIRLWSRNLREPKVQLIAVWGRTGLMMFMELDHGAILGDHSFFMQHFIDGMDQLQGPSVLHCVRLL